MKVRVDVYEYDGWYISGKHWTWALIGHGWCVTPGNYQKKMQKSYITSDGAKRAAHRMAKNMGWEIEQ